MAKAIVEIEHLGKAGWWAKFSGVGRGKEFRAPTWGNLAAALSEYRDEAMGPDVPAPNFVPMLEPRRAAPPRPLQPVTMPPSKGVVRERPGVRRPKRAAGAR